jgi:hypothetical protein
MSVIEFKEKFIAFIDVLGFKSHVKAAELKTGMTPDELLEMLKKFGSSEGTRSATKNLTLAHASFASVRCGHGYTFHLAAGPLGPHPTRSPAIH